MRSVKSQAGRYFWQSQYNSLLDDHNLATFLLPHQQLGAFTLPNQPADGDTVTLTVNGTAIVITAKTSLGAVANQVKIGGSATAFAANVLAFLQNPQFTTSTYVAASQANQQLLSYLSFSLNGTTLNVSSFNATLWAPQTSFSGSTSTAGNAWTGATLKLFVEPGVYWIGGSRYTFAGGSTPAVTAPVSNPRIDVLTIDTSGTLAWTTGAEAASPSVPAYPKDKLVICELYNVTGETALYNNDNQQAGQGYIYNDIRQILNNGRYLSQTAIEIYGGTSGGSANTQTISVTPAIGGYSAGMIFTFIAGFTNSSAVTLNVNSLGAKTIKKASSSGGFTDLGANDITANQLVSVCYDGTNFQMVSMTTSAASSAYGTGFGAWSTPTANANVQASTDLFIVGWTTAATSGTIAIKTDSSSTPSTVRQEISWPNGGSPLSVFCTVKKGDYYNINSSGGSNTFYAMAVS